MGFARISPFFFCWLASAATVGAAEIDELMALLRSDNPIARYNAARSLRDLGAKAEPATELLVAALRDTGAPIEPDIQYFGPRVRDVASDALVKVGRPAVAPLMKALGRDDEDIRAWAAITLGKLGREAHEAHEAFARLARISNDPGEDEWVRYQAIEAMANVASGPDEAAPHLLRIIRSGKDKLVRRAALEALYDADPDATVAIPILIEGLKDSNGDVAAAAARTLGRFGAKARPAAAALNAALASEALYWASVADMGFQVPVRLRVVRTLAEIAPRDDSVEESMRRILETDENEVMRLWAAAALVRMAPADAVPERPMRLLIETFQHDANLRTKAAEVLGVVGNDDAVAALIESLEDDDPSEFGTFHPVVVRALGQIGPAAKNAVPVLRKVLVEQRVGHFSTRREAIIALGKIGPAAAPALPDLANLSAWEGEFLDSLQRDAASEAIERITAKSIPNSSPNPK